MPLPKPLYATKEGRRVYPLTEIINGRKLTELHIDPHYEEKHSEYMNDKKIYELIQQLVQTEEKFIPEARDGEWEYFSFDRLYQGRKAYKIAFCLKDNADFLGVITCHRYRKNDKKINKEQ